MMIGNYVRMIREGADDLEGTLIHESAHGVTILTNRGLDDRKIFVPWTRIVEIVDLGRAPG